MTQPAQRQPHNTNAMKSAGLGAMIMALLCCCLMTHDDGGDGQETEERHGTSTEVHEHETETGYRTSSQDESPFSWPDIPFP